MKKIWEYLSGKKTWIGFSFGLLTGAMYIVNGFKPIIPAEIIRGSEIIATTFGVVGGTHKAVKTDAGKKIIKKVMDRIK